MLNVNFFSVKQVVDKRRQYKISQNFIQSPADAYELINKALKLESSAVERFGILSLNTKNELAGVHVLTIGTLNSVVVHPREIYQAAILNNAASIILFHNHPSGNPEPSKEDIQLTQRIELAGDLMGITMLDHIIIGHESFCSLREEGFLNYSTTLSQSRFEN
jgi:DNA repair protein RadC